MTPLADVIITEFGAIGTELVEVRNRGSEDVDIQGWTLNGSAIDHPTNTGDPVVIGPGTWSWGAADNSGGPDFVYGSITFNDAGDTLVLADQYGRMVDTVDFTSFHTDPDTAVPADAFPGIDGSTTQLDINAIDGDNDDGALWCTTYYYAATEGETNLSCSRFVINEVLYDFDHPNISADDDRVFVELAGPGGGPLGGHRIQGIEGTGASAGSNQQPSYTIADGYRMPVDGLFVLADGDANDGNTEVPGADVVRGAADPENGADAIRLEDAGGTIIDLVGYGSGFVGSNPPYEASPVPDVNPWEVAISIARNAASMDTNDNLTDFHFDPTPTPGAPNDAVVPTLVGYAPDNGLATASTRAGVIVTTIDFADYTSIDGDNSDRDVTASFAGVPAADACDFLDILEDGRGAATMVCTPDDTSTPIQGDFVLTNPPLFGGSATVTGGWLYTGVNNETDVLAELDWCNLQSPGTITGSAGGATGDIFGQIFEAGVTEAAGDSGLVIAEVGFGLLGSDPTTDDVWLWTPAVWNVQVGQNDEFIGQIAIPAGIPAGDYAYTYRYSVDGITWTYGDLDGAGSTINFDFSATQLGVLTVQ